ncbi:hypothetical protein EDD86DRAFT_221198 [Gorgonomyces haynaldii]|nr:hypothetical protein EDD86DRAFT_221198 [Gorgonomyces haynaldii]
MDIYCSTHCPEEDSLKYTPTLVPDGFLSREDDDELPTIGELAPVPSGRRKQSIVDGLLRSPSKQESIQPKPSTKRDHEDPISRRSTKDGSMYKESFVVTPQDSQEEHMGSPAASVKRRTSAVEGIIKMGHKLMNKMSGVKEHEDDKKKESITSIRTKKSENESVASSRPASIQTNSPATSDRPRSHMTIDKQPRSPSKEVSFDWNVDKKHGTPGGSEASSHKSMIGPSKSKGF